MVKQSVSMSHLPSDRDTIIVGNAFVGGLGSLCGIGKDESRKIGPFSSLILVGLNIMLSR